MVKIFLAEVEISKAETLLASPTQFTWRAALYF